MTKRKEVIVEGAVNPYASYAVPPSFQFAKKISRNRKKSVTDVQLISKTYI
jgi:hypothetical protein